MVVKREHLVVIDRYEPLDVEELDERYNRSKKGYHGPRPLKEIHKLLENGFGICRRESIFLELT
jgi:hypothetical protein